MDKITRPLLAVPIKDMDSLVYPQLATAKYDGIRCLTVDGKAVTRNFKPQPNVYIRTYLENTLPSGLDGELILAGGKLYNDVQSEIMSFEGQPDFEYHIFDYVKDSLLKPYHERIKDLVDWYKSLNATHKKYIKLVLPKKLNNKEELVAYEEECINNGFEGVILRKPDGKYKCGRSTLKEGILLKVKRFIDSEAEIVGFEEKLHNNNEKEKNEFGLSKRASCLENLVPAGTLGALMVKELETGIEFNIGSGFDDSVRKQIWDHKSKYMGKIVVFKCQPSGAKDKPRFPVFKGFRTKEDL